MEITISHPTDAHPTISVAGRFDAFEAEAFRATVDECLSGEANHLTVDLQAVNFIDSSGLAELVRAMKHCREGGGELLLHDVSDPVRVILELTRLNIAFEFSNSAD